MQRRQYVDYINMCNVEKKNKKKELRKGPTFYKYFFNANLFCNEKDRFLKKSFQILF